MGGSPAADAVDALLARMSLREKIAQMTQVEKNSVTPDEVAAFGIGSVLSGGGGNPEPNTPASWRAMVEGYAEAARASRLGIPLLYGVDAVHGHNNVVGATVFPHNVGLGAAGDPSLVRRIGRATALETAATGVRWSFAPAVSVAMDPRWGRFYESYGRDPGLVARLAVALVEGFRGDGWTGGDALLPSVKHYLADGAARWGTSRRVDHEAMLAGEAGLDATLAIAGVDEAHRRLLEEGAWRIDQGDADLDEATLRRVHLAPYAAALAAGALNVMASFSSWRGRKMHDHRYLLTEVLKGELGFAGFVVTDWQAVDQIDPRYDRAVARAVAAGIDMVMVPFDHARFIEALERVVERGDVAEARVDDAVRRILSVKRALGLFDPEPPPPLSVVGCAEHRALAREAAARSAVLLKNERGALPLPGDLPELLVAGAAADDVGLQCGGWTVSWMGSPGPITPGATLLDGLRARFGDRVRYAADGDFAERGARAPVGVAVVAEEPYAEGMGDRAELRLSDEQLAPLARLRPRVERLVVVLLSGRPLVVTDEIEDWDAFVAAWLPGSQGDGVVEVLAGERPFEGRLPHPWPRSMAQVAALAEGDGGEAPLFAEGHGLRTDGQPDG